MRENLDDLETYTAPTGRVHILPRAGAKTTYCGVTVEISSAVANNVDGTCAICRRMAQRKRGV